VSAITQGFERMGQQLAGLPEHVANAAREAVPQPKPDTTVGDSGQRAGSKRRSFSDWWYGKK